MRQLIKSLVSNFLWIGCLVLVCQSAWAFSLLGPVANGGDAWQVNTIGYNPLTLGAAPPFFIDALPTGPKNIGEGYRRNTPVMYYAFDPSFSDYFGSNGEFAVQQAFDLLNGVMNGQTNTPVYFYGPNNGILGDTSGAPALAWNPAEDSVDHYSQNLSEFPLNSIEENYTANTLNLLDLKSETLSALVEQLGLADAVRYTWALHDRYIPSGATCNSPGPGNGVEYEVIMRNFDYYLTPLSYNPIDWGQYSPYVNDELYSYYIYDNCGAPGASPPDADALDIPAQPLNNNPPVASGSGEDALANGFFYTGLTRDDAAGLRWLYSTNNYDTPSPAYRESPAAGSFLFSTNLNAPQLLYTSNLNALVSASLTNDPATLQTLFPGLVVGANPATYFSNVVSPNVVAYFTNFLGQPADQPATLVVVTNYVTNIVQFYHYTFANVITNTAYTNTSYAIQTITVGPASGYPADSGILSTNVSYQPFQSNVVSGDYFTIPSGTCGYQILQTLQTNLVAVTNTIVTTATNTLVTTTNVNGQMFTENLISYYTNHVFAVAPCALVPSAVADYQGIGRIQFIRVSDSSDPYDYQSGTFTTPITNQYNMVIITNGQAVTETFQRVVTTPDFVFGAADLANGPAALPTVVSFSRNINFNQANIQPGDAGPGTIDPPTTITFDKVGPVYYNLAPSFLSGSSSITNLTGTTTIGTTINYAGLIGFVWGSFDGTTNAPVLYPNGTSLANLTAASLVRISPPPPALPSGAKGVYYNVPLTVLTGALAPYSWTLASDSASLPPGLTLSSNGVISGTPTQSGTFNYIAIQMTDSSTPPLTVETIYSLTINN